MTTSDRAAPPAQGGVDPGADSEGELSRLAHQFFAAFPGPALRVPLVPETPALSSPPSAASALPSARPGGSASSWPGGVSGLPGGLSPSLPGGFPAAPGGYAPAAPGGFPASPGGFAPGGFAPSSLPSGTPAVPGGFAPPATPGGDPQALPSALAPPPLPGASHTPPPVPGFAHALPVASAPPPRESDLRSIPAAISNVVGVQPVVLAGSVAPSATPYFLEIAGLPGASPFAQPSSPSPFSPSPSAQPSSPSPFSPSPSRYQPEPARDPGAGSRIFDAASIKRDFPILEERVHGKPLIWLDNAATTQKPRAVIERLAYFYEHENSNIHRAAHALAARATDAYEAARDKVRRFLNAPSVEEIVFVRGATEAINLVAQSYGRRNVGPGDEIVITWLEHHANIVPWQILASEKGARLRVAPVDDRGQIILEEYERLLGPRTRIVSIPHVSNALGTIVPIAEMTAMAHRHGARVLIDGAQAVSHLPVDVAALDCDFYCFSGHKVFAPTGIGVLFGKKALLDNMPPWQGGGNMIADVTFDKTVYQAAPGRFEAGTGNIADAVGLGAALDYLTGLGLPNVSRYEHELLEYGTERLARVPGLHMIGTAPEKAGVLSFVLDGTRTEDVGGALDREGIAVRSGHHCAQPILRRFGLESSVRASLAPYNTRDDLDALQAALLRLQAGRPARGL